MGSAASMLAVWRRIDPVLKGMGLPAEISSRFGLAGMKGSHIIGHTRMATESAVTTNGAHPFSTGSDQCLVHNGSLSNHNNLRRELKREGMKFETENDTEVGARFALDAMPGKQLAIDADMDAVGLEIGMLVAVGVTRLRVGAMPVLRQGGRCDTQQGGGRCGADGAVQNAYDGHDQTPL